MNLKLSSTMSSPLVHLRSCTISVVSRLVVSTCCSWNYSLRATKKVHFAASQHGSRRAASSRPRRTPGSSPSPVPGSACAIDLSVVSVSGMYNNSELLSSMEADGLELGKKAEAIFSGRKITFSTEVGYPAQTILSKATNMDADLLVLGTHGRTGLGRIVLGSVAENVLRQAKCNTLVIPVKHI